MAALFRAAWDWYMEQEPCTKQHADKRARVRRLLNEERSKPAGERDRARELALLEEDLFLHYRFYFVRTQTAGRGTRARRLTTCWLPPLRSRLRRCRRTRRGSTRHPLGSCA